MVLHYKRRNDWILCQLLIVQGRSRRKLLSASPNGRVHRIFGRNENLPITGCKLMLLISRNQWARYRNDCLYLPCWPVTACRRGARPKERFHNLPSNSCLQPIVCQLADDYSLHRRCSLLSKNNGTTLQSPSMCLYATERWLRSTYNNEGDHYSLSPYTISVRSMVLEIWDSSSNKWHYPEASKSYNTDESTSASQIG